MEREVSKGVFFEKPHIYFLRNIYTLKEKKNMVTEIKIINIICVMIKIV